MRKIPKIWNFSKVYLSQVYFCKMYPTCMSSKLCEFVFNEDEIIFFNTFCEWLWQSKLPVIDPFSYSYLSLSCWLHFPPIAHYSICLARHLFVPLHIYQPTVRLSRLDMESWSWWRSWLWLQWRWCHWIISLTCLIIWMVNIVFEFFVFSSLNQSKLVYNNVTCLS